MMRKENGKGSWIRFPEEKEFSWVDREIIWERIKSLSRIYNLAAMILVYYFSQLSKEESQIVT